MMKPTSTEKPRKDGKAKYLFADEETQWREGLRSKPKHPLRAWREELESDEEDLSGADTPDSTDE